jgi:hypothetical protein
MCDYSLHGLKNRLANKGKQLFIHKFHTGSKGLASVADSPQVLRYSNRAASDKRPVEDLFPQLSRIEQR